VSTNTYSGFVVLAVFIIIGGLFVRQWRRADVSRDVGRGEVRYQAPVLVRARDTPGVAFQDLTSGFDSLILTIKGDVIAIRLPWLRRRLAATLGLDHTFFAHEASMYSATVGWGGTRLLRRESIVLFGRGPSGPIELAIAPKDKDLKRLRRALADAGVDDETAAPAAPHVGA
jgi:hypothetical protein